MTTRASPIRVDVVAAPCGVSTSTCARWPTRGFRVPSGAARLMLSTLTLIAVAQTPRGVGAFGCSYSAAIFLTQHGEQTSSNDQLFLNFDNTTPRVRGEEEHDRLVASTRGNVGVHDGNGNDDVEKGEFLSPYRGYLLDKKRKLLEDRSDSSSSTPTAPSDDPAVEEHGAESCRVQAGIAGGGHMARDASGWSAYCPDADSPYATPLRQGHVPL